MFLKHIKIKTASSAGFENQNSGSKYVYVLFKLIRFSVNFDLRRHQEIRMEQNRGVVVITIAQLLSTKPEFRLCAGSDPARGVSEIRDGEDL